MEPKHLKKTALIALFWVLIALALVGAATYAWFSFNRSTLVDALPGQMTEVETEHVIDYVEQVTTRTVTETIDDEPMLEISNDNENFGTECEIVLDGNFDGTLEPVSTDALDDFFAATAQLPNGISVRFRDVTDQVDVMTMHGKVYLRMTQNTASVYFDPDNMSFSGDGQALAALRFGMKTTLNGTENTYVFTLDSMGDTAGAESRQTIGTQGTVISAIDGEGKATLVTDPGESIQTYTAGNTALGELGDGDVMEIEYWVYLEGCDDNCFNPVQKKELNLRLGFTTGQ